MLRQLSGLVLRRALPVMERRNFSQTAALWQSIKNYSPNNLEKKMLVWSGKYKTIEEIPPHVSSDVMERSRNKMRIRLANIMILLTIIGCGIMIYSGKQAAKRGESVAKQNLDWHKKYNENAAKSD